jgi:hypothetical protein
MGEQRDRAEKEREGKMVEVNRITEPYSQYFAFPNTFSSLSTSGLLQKKKKKN